MAAIFANASVTIIASDGEDANSGLRGLHDISGISGSRSVTQGVHPLTRDATILEMPMLGDMEPTTWSKRGWTYQEALFSKRKIIFEHNWVRWECQCAVWNEFNDTISKNLDYGSGILSLATEVPDVIKLSEMVQEYNIRLLTFPEDILPAFSGITSALSHTYDGFISGLPVLLFHIGLLWKPDSTLRRRMPVKSEVSACLPSWSWAGWHGQVLCWGRLATDFFTGMSKKSSLPFGERVFPLVQWSWLEKQNGTRTHIRDRWYEYKEKFWNKFGTTSPSGWTRHHTVSLPPLPAPILLWSQESLPTPEDPLYFYTHESEPESKFWYPLPSPEASQHTKTQIVAPFISCKTRRG
ncbi:hypothetical protein Hte_004682 [Hypoxylon texense]